MVHPERWHVRKPCVCRRCTAARTVVLVPTATTGGILLAAALLVACQHLARWLA